MTRTTSKPFVAIACGGTGGHLFPGLAVAEALLIRGCEVGVIISPKDVDQQAVKCAQGVEVFTVPAFGLSRGQVFKSGLGFLKSFRAVKNYFRQRPPQAVLATGGFTSVAPVLAGKLAGAATFLHESNTIPGKANRWLAHVVDQAFIGFPSAGSRLSTRKVLITGTPVRPQFEPGDAASARMALGLQPKKPVLMIMGGSQGAAGINDLVLRAVPELLRALPELQFLHLTGEKEFKKVLAAYEAQRCVAAVRPFLTEMEIAMAAATLAVSRAGASTLAELAAMRLPSILIPYPTAADNHQYYNAAAVVDAGAALLLEQRETTPERLSATLLKLLLDEAALAHMKEELIRWHSPRAADVLAEKILAFIRPLALRPGDEAKALQPDSRQPGQDIHKEQPPSVLA